jgi:ubiquitin-like modifier-activating enzyme 5
MGMITTGGIGGGRVDTVLSCVDNFQARQRPSPTSARTHTPLCPLPIRALAGRSRPDVATGRAQARMSINAACNELAQTWFESGVSEDAVSGHIQLLKPGELACFECAPPLVVASGIDEKTLKCALTQAPRLIPGRTRKCAPRTRTHAHMRRREGVCAASLPTTMGIVAGFLVQNALKFLLQFGEVSEYVGYIALKDHFPRMTLRPNPECVSSWCRKQQGLFQKREVERKAAEALLPPPPPPPPPPPLHTSNDWGIEVDSDDDDEVAAAPQPAAARQQLAEGIEYAHVTSDQLKETVKEEDKLGEDDGTDLASLMAQLSGVQNVD